MPSPTSTIIGTMNTPPPRPGSAPMKPASTLLGAMKTKTPNLLCRTLATPGRPAGRPG